MIDFFMKRDVLLKNMQTMIYIRDTNNYHAVTCLLLDVSLIICISLNEEGNSKKIKIKNKIK